MRTRSDQERGRGGVPPTGACDLPPLELSAYLDGELAAGEVRRVEEHLHACGACAERLESYRGLGEELRRLAPPPTPADLGLRLRVEASHYSVRHQRWEYLRMRCAMALEALALPTAVGTVATLFLFIALTGGVRSNIVNNPMAPDVPVFGLATPPQFTAGPDASVSGPVLVEADVDANGRVYNYRVLSGAHDPQTIEQLNNQLLLSVFTPATTIFGQPTNGSVLVSYGTVDVRG